MALIHSHDKMIKCFQCALKWSMMINMYITEFNSMKSDQPVSNISVQRPFLPQNVKHCDIQFTDLGYFNEKKTCMVIMK